MAFDLETLGRRLRGALGTAMIWGGGWVLLGVAVMAIVGVLSVVGILPGGFSMMEAVIFAVRIGIVGGVAGVAFSTFIRLFFHGRRLSELSWVKFAVGGAFVTGVAVPAFLQTMNLLSGDGLVAWNLVLDDAAWTAVFGAVAAGGSLKLAQVGERLQPGDDVDLLDGMEDPGPALGGGEPKP